ALFASFIASGQTCVQGAKLLLHRSIARQVVERLVDRAASLRMGDPSDTATQLGPLASEAQRNRVAEAVERARQQGAAVALGGTAPEDVTRGWFYSPTIITDVTPEMDIWREEVFGPVVVVSEFDSDQEAIDKANDSPFGLAASI